VFNAAVSLTPTTRLPCSNAAKTRNPLKFAGVPQTNEPISAASRPKFTILSGHIFSIDSATSHKKTNAQRMGDILLFNKFFPIADTCLLCEDIARQSCAMMPRWLIFGDFLRPVFSPSRVQHVSDPRLKFALRSHHVSKYGRHPICDG